VKIAVSDAEAFAAARQTLLANLKDPKSAEIGKMYRNEYRSKERWPFGGPSANRDVVCGLVNAKNSYGGYNGNTLFAYVIDTKKVYLDGEGDDSIEKTRAALWCRA
jgi:hypothetical protein